MIRATGVASITLDAERAPETDVALDRVVQRLGCETQTAAAILPRPSVFSPDAPAKGAALLRLRNDQDLNATVRLATRGGRVVGDRAVRAVALQADTASFDPALHQVIGHAGRALLGQTHVVI